MNSVTSTARKRDGKPKLFRFAPEFSAGSARRDLIVGHLMSVIPAAQRPARIDPVENLPALYAAFRTGQPVGPDEVGLVRNQLRIEAGLIQPPMLRGAGRSLAELPVALCRELESKRMQWPVALTTLRVAATIYRLFQLWNLRELREQLPIQLEPNFVRKWMAYPNEDHRLVEEPKAMFLRPRLDSPKFRQQRKRAQAQLVDNSAPTPSVAQVIRALQWLQVVGFIRVVQYHLRVKGWHGIPRYELSGYEVGSVADLTYPTFGDHKRNKEKRVRARIALAKAAQRVKP